ncbi:hypothetical protein D9M70_502690 [compost metagenome]
MNWNVIVDASSNPSFVLVELGWLDLTLFDKSNNQVSSKVIDHTLTDIFQAGEFWNLVLLLQHRAREAQSLTKELCSVLTV